MRLLRDSTANTTSAVFNTSEKGAPEAPVAQVSITGAGTDAPTVTLEGRIADMAWTTIVSRTASGFETLPRVDEIRAVVTGQGTSPKTINVEVE